MRKGYPSDINREQFEQILELLETACKKLHPRQVDLYGRVLCGVIPIEKRLPRRLLPSDFPKWRTVHHYFALWSEKPEKCDSLLELALKNQVGEARVKQDRVSSGIFWLIAKDCHMPLR